MSTRANIVIMDEDDTLWFYRHSDGYPDGALPTLKIFLQWVADGKIRNNVSQASGWLIMIGAQEYNKQPVKTASGHDWVEKETLLEPAPDPFLGWKVGAYEPTSGIHGDIDYLYEVDLVKEEIRVFECEYVKGKDGIPEARKGKKIQTVKARKNAKLKIACN